MKNRKKTSRSFFCTCHSLLERAITRWTKGMSQNRFDSAYLDNLGISQQFQSTALPVVKAGTASWQCAPLCLGWHVIRTRAVWAGFKCSTLSFKAVYGISISQQSVTATGGLTHFHICSGESSFLLLSCTVLKGLEADFYERFLWSSGPPFKHKWPGWLVWYPSSWPTSGATQCRVGSWFGVPWQKMRRCQKFISGHGWVLIQEIEGGSRCFATYPMSPEKHQNIQHARTKMYNIGASEDTLRCLHCLIVCVPRVESSRATVCCAHDPSRSILIHFVHASVEKRYPHQNFLWW